MQDNKIPKMRRPFNERSGKKQIARTVKQRLALLITFLIVLLLLFIFKVGEVWWPVWMIEHPRQITGILLLAIICVILLSPVLIEADSNPRVLSGPGKNPKGPRLE
jgi:predicted ABC-type exoprotein transport system permease subunit